MRIVVVLPVGPADDAADTIESVLQFTNGPLAIIAIDDVGGATSDTLRQLDPAVRVIPAPRKAAGNRGGLWVKLAAGYRYALEHFSFDVLLRIDADTLIIRECPVEQAIQRFQSDSLLGMLGAYRVSGSGGSRDFSPAAKALTSEIGWRGRREPARRATLRDLRGRARQHGYQDGEHCLGAAYFHRSEAVREMASRGWLQLPQLASSMLSEDHLFGLMTVAAGYTLGDFAGPGQPLGVQWIGLPFSPAELVTRGFSIVHSVRHFDGLTERDIRSFFREQRHQPITM